VRPDRLLTGNAEQHTTEFTEFRGRRPGWLEETPEARRRDMVRVKRLTTSPICARRMRQDSISFENTTTMLINSNYLPQVDETDHGTWRRLVAVPFAKTYRTDPGRGELSKDEALRPRLVRAGSAG
jgi:putative DNA primase/helicase